ncbi:hypothetical protein LJR084_005769 [Variovorax sp. LjRoot84]|uniref:hypothetical protein n=1 Tax=Variovorax sp. LjRoot84 TaxID=3342340 RepID=UPI003ECD7EB2
MLLSHSSELKMDAYLLWALYTGFRYFDIGESRKTVLLVKFDKRLDATTLRALRNAGLWLCDFYVGYSCATVTASIPNLDQQLADLKRLGAEYCELAAPVAPPTQDEGPAPRIAQNGPATVIGIIDDGCPFAHLHYRRPDDPSLRVRYIWDQGGSAPSGAVPPSTTPFAYGATYGHDQLEEILSRATLQGVVDEDAAYGLTELPSLRGATSHGAQVMSHAAGFARKIDGRQQPKPLIGRTDLAFVQLPPDALDDPSGGWLEHYGLDALHAIRFYARHTHKTSANKVIVNLSYGPQTGPHDGTSVLERAIDEMTSTAIEENYQFLVVVPTGNNHQLRAHAEFDLARRGGTIDWFVSPDSQVPSLLEIWLPDGVTLDDVEVAVETPADEHIVASDILPEPPKPLTVPDDTQVLIVAIEGPPPGNRIEVIIGIAPTARPSAGSGAAAFALATPGIWRVTVEPKAGKTVPGVAHAYLGRSDANMGRARRGRSGYLYSPGYDPKRFSRADEQLDVGRENAPAEVVASGAMNGIGTGTHSLVAAGYRLSDGQPAPYSAGGPTRGNRKGPDWAYPTEESRVLAGLLAAGNRSATVLRLTGTSIAAPQYVRELAAMPGSNALPPPTPTPPSPPAPPPWLKARAGAGLR